MDERMAELKKPWVEKKSQRTVKDEGKRACLGLRKKRLEPSGRERGSWGWTEPKERPRNHSEAWQEAWQEASLKGLGAAAGCCLGASCQLGQFTCSLLVTDRMRLQGCIYYTPAQVRCSAFLLAQIDFIFSDIFFFKKQTAFQVQFSTLIFFSAASRPDVSG